MNESITTQTSEPADIAADGDGLESRLDRIIGDSLSRGQTCALVLVALDDVEVVDAIIGHEAGESVMAKARWELSLTLDSRDGIEPWGETGFAIVMRDCNAVQLFEACRRYRNAVRDHRFVADGRTMTLSVAVGTVLLPGGGRTGRLALTHAQEALEQARGDRARSIVIHRRDYAAEQRHAEDRRLGDTVVAELARERMRLSFQPVVCAVSGRTVFHEALVRIADGSGALRAASTFIGATERLGLVPMVDNCVLDLSLRQLDAADNAVLSLNVSHATMRDGAWMKRLEAACADDATLAERLTVEIGSAAVTAHFDDCLAFADRLRALGVRIALDDFGTGATLLQGVHDLDCDIVKIDAGIGGNILQKGSGQVLVTALIAIARAAGAQVVLKGVDRPEVGTLAREWGVDYLQGYATGLPVAVAHWPARGTFKRLAGMERAAG